MGDGGGAVRGHADVGGASANLRVLAVGDGHPKRTVGTVAARIRRSASDRVGALIERGATKRRAQDAAAGTVVGEAGHKAHVARALAGRGAHREVAWTTRHRALGVSD